MERSQPFALLDDSSSDSKSRFYTGYSGSIVAAHGRDFDTLMAQLAAAIERGLHAVLLLDYELGREWHGLPAPDGKREMARALLFERCDLLDAAAVQAWLADHCAEPAGIAELEQSVTAEAFKQAIDRIQQYLAAGDSYQVNYTYRLRFRTWGEPAALYAALRARQPVPYGALIGLPDGSAVVSLSPELFLRHQGGELFARPMKGTAPAHPDPAVDQRRAAALAADPKNRAENLMIVDLLRNDLGRIAVSGSVTVPALFDVQRHGEVLQMTSSIRARLQPGMALGDVLRAVFPCGSITGAPKRRTMQIIDELENTPRGLYTGAIGWVAPGGVQTCPDFCLSVPIRTLVLDPPRNNGERRGEMGVGAGIVMDSEARSEYAECQLKARFLSGLTPSFTLIETMHAQRGGIRHEERHLARLARSATQFGFRCDLQQIRALLAEHCSGMEEGCAFRLRLGLHADGHCELDGGALAPLSSPVRVLVARRPIKTSALFLGHKTSVRAAYDAAWRAAEQQGAFDTLFFNREGHLTEGGRSNVFVKLDGRWRTPPLRAGVLPGVMRSVLLEDPAWNAAESLLTEADLRRAQGIVVCNALRGALPATVDWDEAQDGPSTIRTMS